MAMQCLFELCTPQMNSVPASESDKKNYEVGHGEFHNLQYQKHCYKSRGIQSIQAFLALQYLGIHAVLKAWEIRCPGIQMFCLKIVRVSHELV